jgi:hypothetical protein
LQYYLFARKTPGLFGGVGALMLVVAAAAHRPLDIREHPCRRLGRDEGKLLRLLILLQRDRVMEASAAPGDWRWRAATRIAARDAGMLAATQACLSHRAAAPRRRRCRV